MEEMLPKKPHSDLEVFVKLISHKAHISFNLPHIQPEFSKICIWQMDSVLVFMPFWYSASRPSLLSEDESCSPLSESLCSF